MVERGTAYTVSYSRALQLLIQNEISAGNAGPIDSYLVTLNHTVELSVDRQVQQALADQMKAEQLKVAKPEGKGRGRPNAVAVNAGDTLGPPPAPGKGRGKAAGGVGLKKPYICFHHDPANNKVCPNKQTCRDEHLDTKQSDGRERYDKAFANYRGPRSSTKKKAGD